MVLSKILLGILHVQLLVPVFGNNPVLEITSRKIALNADLEVAFTYEDSSTKPSKHDFVGIYNGEDGSEEGGTDYEGYTYTCGADKDPKIQCANLDAPISGTLTFSANGLSTGYYSANQDWPLNAGKYKVCLFNYDPKSEKYTMLSKCKNFQVDRILKADLKEVAVFKQKTKKFQVGKPITIKFNSEKVTSGSQWIVLHQPDGTLTKQTSDHWVYTGCNNQIGNQRSELCTNMVNKGSVVLNQASQEKWAPPAGEYEVCLVFSINMNADDEYDVFKCSKKNLTIE